MSTGGLDILIILKKFGDILWGTPSVCILIFTGIYYTLKLKGFQFVNVPHILKNTLFSFSKSKKTDDNSISPFQALSTSLAATVGTGNVAGVVVAISLGGPGSVFWMWVSSVIGMITKYAENVLGIFYRQKNKDGQWCGGPMYYIKNGLAINKKTKFLSKPLALLFSVFCIASSFGMGNMTQVSNITSCVSGIINNDSFKNIYVGIIVALLTFIITVGGIKSIGKTMELITPVMAGLYILGCLIVIVYNIDKMPETFRLIIKSAFGFDAVTGGFSGVLIKNSASNGFRKGMFSNEAGLGSSVMINISSSLKEPAKQGMWSIVEVFIDTIIVCSATAFTALCASYDGTKRMFMNNLVGSDVVAGAFSEVFGSYGKIFVLVSVVIFSFTTVVGWYCYGMQATEYLFNKKSKKIYTALFLIVCVVASLFDIDTVFIISDILNGLMALPNIMTLILMINVVKKITENYKNRIILKNNKIRPLISAYSQAK